MHTEENATDIWLIIWHVHDVCSVSYLEMQSIQNSLEGLSVLCDT